MNISFTRLLLPFALTAAACGGNAAQPKVDETLASTSTTEDAVTTPAFGFGTRGGFILYTVDLRVTTAGKADVTRTDVRGSSAKLNYSAKLAAATLRALQHAVPANFSKLPANVYSARFIPDVGDKLITVRGKTVTWHAQPAPHGGQVADAALQAYVDKLSAALEEVSAAEYVTLDRSGGIAADTLSLTISNDGRCHITEVGVHSVDQDCNVATADLVELQARLNRKNSAGLIWYQYGDYFTGPIAADGYAYSINWDGPNGAKTIDSGTGAKEGKTYQLVRDQLEAIARNVGTVQ